MKEGLTVDELDRAIYRYYEHLPELCSVSLQVINMNKSKYLSLIEKNVGKKFDRIKIAIDRFEFKRDNKDFTEEINKKHNPENKRFSKVDSTIAMTDNWWIVFQGRNFFRGLVCFPA